MACYFNEFLFHGMDIFKTKLFHTNPLVEKFVKSVELILLSCLPNVWQEWSLAVVWTI